METLRIEQFREAVEQVIASGLTSHAPLGSSGRDIKLQGERDPYISRISEVSIRLHNSQVELLCTNCRGSFLYYGKWHKNLGVNFITKEHFRVYKKLIKSIGLHNVKSLDKNETPCQ